MRQAIVANATNECARATSLKATSRAPTVATCARASGLDSGGHPASQNLGRDRRALHATAWERPQRPRVEPTAQGGAG
eukprot:7016958-Pyramimonas_sp.AAC.1